MSFVSELRPSVRKVLADVGLDVGTPTLDHSNSSALPAAMLKGFPRLAQKQQ